MSVREAVKVLMQSPFYFRLSLRERAKLLTDFYANHKVNHLPSP